MRASILLILVAGVSAATPPKKITVEKREVRQTLRMGMTAAPRLWAQLSAPVSGVVKDVFVDLASRVKKGDKLATLGGAKPVAVLAPFDGLVVARNAQPGVFAPEGASLFTVIDPSKMRLELEVAEVDVPKIAVGMPVVARFEALPGAQYQAKLSVIVPFIDARSHRLHADAEMDNANLTVIAGMGGEAVIGVASRQGVTAVPLAAVSRQDGDAQVVRADGKRAKITLGIDDGEWVEVTSGLAPGDVVLVGADSGK
jgi:multidrug efflux pump subunit AcrA (membrane-fusion protein)